MSAIDTSTIQGKIAVMQAFADGKQIEFLSLGSTKWKPTSTPAWSWDETCYRIYEEPVIPDEVPWNAVDPKYKYHAFDLDGNGYFYTDNPLHMSTGWGLSEGCLATSVLFVIKRGNQPWDKSLVKRPKDI